MADSSAEAEKVHDGPRTSYYDKARNHSKNDKAILKKDTETRLKGLLLVKSGLICASK